MAPVRRGAGVERAGAGPQAALLALPVHPSRSGLEPKLCLPGSPGGEAGGS